MNPAPAPAAPQGGWRRFAETEPRGAATGSGAGGKGRTGRTRATGAAPQSPMMRARKRPRLRQEGGRDHLVSPPLRPHRRTRPPAARTVLTVPHGSRAAALPPSSRPPLLAGSAARYAAPPRGLAEWCGPVAMAAVASEGRGEHGRAGSAGGEALAAAGGVFPQEQVTPAGWDAHPGAGLGPPVPLPAPAVRWRPKAAGVTVPLSAAGRSEGREQQVP